MTRKTASARRPCGEPRANCAEQHLRCRPAPNSALAEHLAAHGLVLEMLAGPLAGIYDPTGHGRLLFAFFAAMAETERESIRESTLEGLDAAARKGKHGGRPPVITDDMLPTVLR
ncbi:recombinase family protein [Streptomyces avermitilis]|uniref:recombinase family protein n=1 Tax=Streptomyces avermitilis TaxID=33903 RepID=UPI0033F661D1